MYMYIDRQTKKIFIMRTKVHKSYTKEAKKATKRATNNKCPIKTNLTNLENLPWLGSLYQCTPLPITKDYKERIKQANKQTFLCFQKIFSSSPSIKSKKQIMR